MVDRNAGDSKELSSTASTMGMGKKKTNWKAVITRVFVTASQKAWSPRTREKLSNPTNGLSGMPTNGE